MRGLARVEETLVLIKPDGCIRRLQGEILDRLLKSGLALVASRVVLAPERETIDSHLPNEDGWITELGEITLRRCEQTNHNPIAHFGTHDPVRIGWTVRGWIVNFMTSGPIVVFILSGDNAIAKVRKLIGNTVPKLAEKGTIRADFFADTPDLMDTTGVAGQNGIHASDSRQAFEREVMLWMPEYFQDRKFKKRKGVKK